MVNTSDKAELLNCITNAQAIMMEMGPVIDRLGNQQEKDKLKELSGKVGVLLKEAGQRYHKVL